MSNQITTREQAVSFINGSISEYAHLLGADGIKAIEKHCKEEKKPFVDAVKDAVVQKYDITRLAALAKSGDVNVKLLIMPLPKPALLLLAAAIGLKGVSSYKSDDLRTSIVKGKAIHAKPASDLPLMQAANS